MSDTLIGWERIPQKALANTANPWDGMTAAQCDYAATTSTTVPLATATAAGGLASFCERIQNGAQYRWRDRWHVPGILAPGKLSTISAPPGMGKSTLCIGLATACAAGRTAYGPFMINNTPDGLSVIYISAEENCNEVGLSRDAACSVLGLDAVERDNVERNFTYVNAARARFKIGRSGRSSKGYNPDEDTTLREFAAVLADHEIAVLDTLAGTIHLPNELNNSDITDVLQALADVAERTGTSILMPHHSPKRERAAAAEHHGEITAARGGGAIVGSAKGANLTIAPLTKDEAAIVAIAGQHTAGDAYRLGYSKVNRMRRDAAGEYFVIRGEKVPVEGGRHYQKTGVVEFFKLPTPNQQFPNSTLYEVMRVLTAGAKDKNGAHVAFSPSTKGKTNDRSLSEAVGAILTQKHGLTADQAKFRVAAVIEELIRRGWVAAKAVRVPQYKKDGVTANGTKEVQGLVCQWDLTPWGAAPDSIDATGVIAGAGDTL